MVGLFSCPACICLPSRSDSRPCDAATHSTVALPTAAFQQRIKTLARHCRTHVLACMPASTRPPLVLEALERYLREQQGFSVVESGRSALPSAAVLDHRMFHLLTLCQKLFPSEVMRKLTWMETIVMHRCQMYAFGECTSRFLLPRMITELISNFKSRFTQRLQLRLLSTPGYWSCHCPQCRCGEALIVYIYIRGDILPVILQRRGQFGGHAAPSKSALVRSINLKILQIGECLTVVVVWRSTIPTSWAVTKLCKARTWEMQSVKRHAAANDKVMTCSWGLGKCHRCIST
jgi:hypothetical protein